MRNPLLLAILVLTTLLAATKTYSCSCAIYGDGSPNATMRHAKAVFIGEVLEITETTKEQREAGLGPGLARMRVERYWKGAKSSEIFVSTEIGVICGPHLGIGQKYLVYAFGKSLTTICTPTRKLEYASKDMVALGPGKEFKPK